MEFGLAGVPGLIVISALGGQKLVDYARPFRCPQCGKLLPIKFSIYKKELVHKLHSWVDEVNEGHAPLHDPF